MPRNATLGVTERNPVTAIQGFLKDLLAKKLVDAVLVPVEVPNGKNVVQTMVTEADALNRAQPLAPVMPVNSARIISTLTKVAPSTRTIAAVLRSCELRALVELVKLKQADLTNLITIGIDCFGTYAVSDYAAFCSQHAAPTEQYLKGARDGSDPLLRAACRICRYPFPLTADITIGLLGMDTAQEIMVVGGSPAGERVLDALKLDGGADTRARDEALAAVSADRAQRHAAFLEQTRTELAGLDSMLALLAQCVACHNCRVACPICYCRECLLDSPTIMEWEAEKYLGWAEKKGALRMPADSLLFHLVRLNHMGASCVGCGLCEDACPNAISVFKLFCLAGARVQELFSSVPGRSPEDELPLTAFREEEFKSFEK